jgi:hypothetical protein
MGDAERENIPISIIYQSILYELTQHHRAIIKATIVLNRAIRQLNIYVNYSYKTYIIYHIYIYVMYPYAYMLQPPIAHDRF